MLLHWQLLLVGKGTEQNRLSLWDLSGHHAYAGTVQQVIRPDALYLPVLHGVPVVREERLDGVVDGARGRVPGREGRATHGAVS